MPESLENTVQRISVELQIAIRDYNFGALQQVQKLEGKDNLQEALREIVKTTNEETEAQYSFLTLSARNKFGMSRKDKKMTEQKIEMVEKIWELASPCVRSFWCELPVLTDNNHNDKEVLDHIVKKFASYRDQPEQCNSSTVIKDSNEGIEIGNEVTVSPEVNDGKESSILIEAIHNFNVDQVEMALKGYDKNVEEVLRRLVHCGDGKQDFLLVYPLYINCNENLNQENVKKIKEIFELMLGYASPGLNQSAHVMNALISQQEYFAKVPGVGEGCFKDLIQKFEERLSKDLLVEYKDEYNKGWEGALLAIDDIVANSKTNGASLQGDEKEDTVGATTVTSTNGNKTQKKNDTNFLSEHKGKIALGVTGLCVVGAIAAYVLAYPAVALALTVLAAVILMGAGIAKVCEKVKNPSVDKVFDKKEQLLNQ